MSFFDIEFKVNGNPKALKRHRTFRKGDFTGSYDPSQDDKASFLAVAHQYKPDQPYDEPLYVKFTFSFKRPKSHFRTGKNAHLLKDRAPRYHTSTPDADNLIKFVCDSLNGVFWRDDSIICNVQAEKLYDTVPSIEVRICKINKFQALWEQDK
jgi:Holliday junction resolvase RusA-like endonuclease